MKRKLALLLAVAMMLSMLPQVSLFAASSNSLSKVPTTTNVRAAYVESNLLPPELRTTSLEIEKNIEATVKTVVDGTYLQIRPDNTITAGSEIKVQLENARWFFTDGNSGHWSGLITGTALTVAEDRDLPRLTSVSGSTGSYTFTSAAVTPSFTRDASTITSTNLNRQLGYSATDLNDFNLYRTWRKYNLIAQPTSAQEGSAGSPTAFTPALAEVQLADYTSATSTYVRFAPNAAVGNGIGSSTASNNTRAALVDGTQQTIVYSLTVSSADPKVATIRFPNEIQAYESGVGTPAYDRADGAPAGTILIPIVVRSTTDDSADVKISIVDNNYTSISGGSWIFGTSSDTLTNTYVDDPQTARDEFPLNRIVIKEQRVSSMGNGTIRISAPSGFEFAQDALTHLTVIAENFAYGTSETLVTGITTGPHATLAWKNTRGEIDYSAFDITFNDLSENKSNRVAGTIYILDSLLSDANHSNHFKLVADDGAAFGDINMKIANVKDSSVTAQTFIGGTRKDWTINLTALGDIPTLVNGRYYEEDAVYAEDDYHLAATVSFKENTVNAWWSGRVTDFVLPEGVKIRKAEIIKAKKVEQKDDLINDDRSSTPYEENYYLNSGKKDGYVTVKDNVLSISNVQVEKDEKADIEMKLWLSIESGYEGDVTLTVTGSAITDEVDPIVIAKAVSPVEIKTTVTDVKIGYQYFPVADIELIETAAGMLEKDKQVWITATDRIYTDMYFTPGFKWEVTEGNIKIKNVDLGTGSKIVVSRSGKITNSTSADLGSGTIVFDVSSASSTASTITFSNMQLKVDRSVPESSETHYSAYAWGPNIAPNANIFDYAQVYGTATADMTRGYSSYVGNDQHSSIGISAPYVRVVTAAGDKNSILSSVVKVTVGSGTAYVNGDAVTVDPAPFIDTTTSRMMVPVRAVSYLLGINPGQVIWSDADHTVTINMVNRTIQFTIGSDIFLINGAQVRMDTSAMIVDGRTFIPFRYLGDALGVSVSYDDSTKTATFNSDNE